jgi:hypothetical protein
VVIGEKLDLFHTLSELVEHCEAALKQSAAVSRRLYAMRRPIEQAHAKRMLKIGDRLRHDGPRDRELLRRLRAPSLGCHAGMDTSALPRHRHS